jgi:hypothetical protein
MIPTNAKFPKEHGLVSHLMSRLEIAPTEYIDPNENGPETGVDVIAVIGDRRIGIQVTELDTGATPGDMRAQEVRTAKQSKKNGHETYFSWAQNDPAASVAAIIRAIERKVGIAARHDFTNLHEVWLLVACGVPVPVGTVSTMITTAWITTDALSADTQNILTDVKYDRIFVYSILGVEEKALYQWDVTNGWRKDVPTPDPRTMRPSVFDVLKDPEWLRDPERRCEQEIERVLREFRDGTDKPESIE